MTDAAEKDVEGMDHDLSEVISQYFCLEGLMKTM
jgi:hypothetical protein